MKIIIKYAGYIILGLVAFVVVYLLAAYVLSRITIDKAQGGSNDVTIYIKTNGVHTDLVVPVKNEQTDWTKEIKFSNAHLADTTIIKYIAMGWGDKGFYLQTPAWADLRFSTAFKATFGLSSTAIHATFYGDLTENKSCKKILISKTQYAQLVNFINSSFQKDAAQQVIRINTSANYNNADAFYEANGCYNLFYTCNTWANSALKKCGQKACLWTPFDTGIFLKYK